MSIHAQLSRMTTPHAPAPVSVHPSEDAGVPQVSALWHTTVAGRLHSLFGCYCTDPAKVAFVEELQRALEASVSPVPAPTPEAVQDALKVAMRERELTICGRVYRFTNHGYGQWAWWEQRGTDYSVRADRPLSDALDHIAHLATPQPPREGEIHPDTARLDTAQRLFSGCDFAWGDPEHPRSVVVLDIPDGVRVGADFRAFLDAATPEGRTDA